MGKVKESACRYCMPDYDSEFIMEHNVQIGTGVFALEAVVEEGELCIGLTDFIYGQAKINYCPMCGRKL